MSDVQAVRIPLIHGGEAIIDAGDLALVAGYRWRRRRFGRLEYAVASTVRDGVYTSVCMHRLILGLTKADRIHVDHENHDGLDNRRGNLRTATPRQNAANSRKQLGTSSRFIGTHKKDGSWSSRIELPGKAHRKSISLGQYGSEAEAAYAYGFAAKAFRDTAFLYLVPIPPSELPGRRRLNEIRSDVLRRIEAALSGRKVKPGSTSIYSGVYQQRVRGTWHVQFRHNRKSLSFGPFRSDHEGAWAYNVAVDFLGKDGRRNVIPAPFMPDEGRQSTIRKAIENVIRARAAGIKGNLPGRFILSRDP